VATKFLTVKSHSFPPSPLSPKKESITLKKRENISLLEKEKQFSLFLE